MARGWSKRGNYEEERTWWVVQNVDKFTPKKIGMNHFHRFSSPAPFQEEKHRNPPYLRSRQEVQRFHVLDYTPVGDGSMGEDRHPGSEPSPLPPERDGCECDS